MTDAHDPTADTGETVSAIARTAVAAGVAGARTAVSRRHEAADAARLRADGDRKVLEGRLRAEADLAFTVYRRVSDPSWWDRVGPDRVEDAWRAATAMAGHDPRAAGALDAMRAELARRPGLARLLADRDLGPVLQQPGGPEQAVWYDTAGEAHRVEAAGELDPGAQAEARRVAALVAVSYPVGPLPVAARVPEPVDGRGGAGRGPEPDTGIEL